MTNSDYHFWKIRIVHILTLKDLEILLKDEIPTLETSKPEEIAKWKKGHRKANAIIGLTLLDDLLAKYREVEASKAMWVANKNVFERQTLFNKLSPRRRFYTATMTAEEC